MRDVFEDILAVSAASYDEYLTEALAHQGDPGRLSDDERFALWIYSSTEQRWYARINTELRSGCGAAVGRFSKVLNGALKKLPRHDGIAYRGYTALDLDAFVGTYDVGAQIRWLSFTSSSTERSKAFDGNVLFIIKSQNGRLLGRYADKPAEEEVLFSSGTLFLVKGLERDGDIVIVDLEERPG